MYPQEKLTLLEAIEKKVGKSQTTFMAGTDFDKPIDIEKAVTEAQNSDVVFLDQAQFLIELFSVRKAIDQKSCDTRGDPKGMSEIL